jgi:glycerate kinase
LVVAPDKFRGTATAAEVASAVRVAALTAGWTSVEVPMSDGGEGLLDIVGGTPQHTEVQGPLGAPTLAEWRMLDETPDQRRTAVIEMSQASGRALLPRPRRDNPVDADTTGVGQLILAARDAGAERIVVGCGGSSTTDGGWGAVQAVGSRAAVSDVELVVACDVTTAFGDAARLFGPQKGASPEQIVLLSDRLASLSERYRRDFGVDVDALSGAGAAGGLAGGLAALGARISPGFDLVAELTGLPELVAAADLVVTGEGHLDPPSFQGKVPGGILKLVDGRCPVLCVVGGADAAVLRSPPPGIDIVSLSSRFGMARARRETLALITEVTGAALARFCP